MRWWKELKQTFFFFFDCRRELLSQFLISSMSPSDSYQDPLSDPVWPLPASHQNVLFLCVKPDHGVHLFKTCQWLLIWEIWFPPLRPPSSPCCLLSTLSADALPTPQLQDSLLDRSSPGHLHPSLHLPFVLSHPGAFLDCPI